MPIETPLNVSPYFDDYDELKDFLRILYKPDLAVQAREMNQLQTILQKQIERFGDAVFSSGTIVDGCNFSFIETYPYVKILDIDQIGEITDPAQYVGMFVRNANNLVGHIVNYADGFESTAPDFKTIFVRYINSGDDFETHAFVPGDVLTVTDANVSIFRVNINNGGVGFANSDMVVFTPSIAVNVSSGSFAVSDYVTQPGTNANLQITAIDSVSRADLGQIVLTLKPRDIDLANSSSNSQSWMVVGNNTITSQNSAVGSVEHVFGQSAAASIVTDGSGRVIRVNMSTQGSGYDVLPTARIRSANNSAGLTSLSLTAQNYKTKLLAANTVDAVGNGYAFAVSNGVIYQKGMFLRVEEQSVIVSKYSQTPDGVAVGFYSEESIIDANIDSSLFDNAGGFENRNAPGADRLKVVPKLTVVEVAQTTPDFLKICIWSEGNPYQQNPTSVYSNLGDKIAQGISETSGNFSIDKFKVVSRSPANTQLEGNTFSVVVDPGKAYIDGYRVETTRNFVMNIPKATDSFFTNNFVTSLNYGNWIRIDEVAGSFQFNTGDIIKLYDAPKNYYSNTSNYSTGNQTPVGNQIGQARIRSMMPDEGRPGTGNASYKLYLFDIRMNAGKNFADVRSVYYDGATKGIADIVTQLSPTTGQPMAILANTEFDALVFRSGVETLKNAANTTYIYRTIDSQVNIANTGIITKSVASDPFAVFDLTPGVTLSNDELRALYIAPVTQSLSYAANASGTVSCNTTSSTITGTATTFAADFREGDYVNVWSNSSVSVIRQVQTVVNNSVMIVDANSTFTASGAAIYRTFPRYVPIPFGYRSGLSGNTSANGSVLTLDLGGEISQTANVIVAFNVVQREVPAGTKAAIRNKFVKISTANNADGTIGPWCLGVPDAFRLRKVYQSTSSTVNTASRDVTSYFYIDSNQNKDYLDLSYLYVNPNSGFVPTTSDWFLVEFDYFNSTGRYFNSVSYLTSNLAVITTNDALPLANLSSEVNSFEVPELYTAKGEYYDMLSVLDFRPVAANTVAVGSSSGTAPVNPAYSLSFGNTADPANDLKFPAPDSFLRANLEYFGARIDSVFVAKDGNIFTISGVAAQSRNAAKAPNQPNDTMKLNDILVPPYPNMPVRPSAQMNEILDRKIANERFNETRLAGKQIINLLPMNMFEQNQPTAYTMFDIGKLERRIENLEYYVRLSSLETDMINKVILSGDGETNRFKFGIFVDSFETPISQDNTNPAYAASLVQGKLTPSYYSWDVNYAASNEFNQPYVDYPLISQDNATYPKPQPPVINPPVTPPVIIPQTKYTGTLTGYGGWIFNQVFTNINSPTESPATKIILGQDFYAYYGDGSPRTMRLPQRWIATGLKPNTKHRFIIQGIDDSAGTYAGPYIILGNGQLGTHSNLISDANGILRFMYWTANESVILSMKQNPNLVQTGTALWYDRGGVFSNGVRNSWGGGFGVVNPTPVSTDFGKMTFQLVAENSTAQATLPIVWQGVE